MRSCRSESIQLCARWQLTSPPPPPPSSLPSSSPSYIHLIPCVRFTIALSGCLIATARSPLAQPILFLAIELFGFSQFFLYILIPSLYFFFSVTFCLFVCLFLHNIVLARSSSLVCRCNVLFHSTLTLCISRV